MPRCLTSAAAARTFFVCLGCVLFVGCEPRDIESDLRQAVIDFHARYNEGKFDEIYDRSSRLFRRRVSREENANTFSALYERYGRVVTSSQAAKLENTVQEGRIFMLTYTTKFEHGSAAEMIGFRDATTERGVRLALYLRTDETP